MTMINTSTNPYSTYNSNAAIANYSTGLSVITQSETTSSTSSNETAAYALSGNLALLNQLDSASSSNSLQTLQNIIGSNSTSSNGTLPSITSYITDSPLGLQKLATMTPAEFEYLNNQSTTKASGSSTTTPVQSAIAANEQINPADILQTQMDDSQLYNMDPALLAIAQGATSAAYAQSQQAPVPAGLTVNTLA